MANSEHSKVQVAKSKRSKGSSRGKYRSAVTGRYVTVKHGKGSPKTTVTESSGARARSIKRRLRSEGKHFDDSTEIIRRDRESG